MVEDNPQPRRRQRRPTAGKRLRAEMDSALIFARREQNQPLLEFAETDLQLIERAAAAANRAEQIQRLYDDEMAGARNAALLVKLSGELRLCEKQAVDLIARVCLGAGPQKSARHQYSANQRWNKGGA
jgi:hypothetical protein